MTIEETPHQESAAAIKVIYNDDPDKGKAGQGLDMFPLVSQVLGPGEHRYWMMSPSEKVALIFLLEHLKPKVAIEIGTANGGSLQVLSRLSGHVYSIDKDEDVPRRLRGLFPNVEYLIGSSDEVLPPLLESLQRNHSELGFVLVDGDHSAEGVRKDINHLLRFRPTTPLYIIMHDSFNPQCRLGLRHANWSSNRYVHAVELDFISGTVNPAPAFQGQLWGGLAMGILLPHERQGRFEITARSEGTFQAVTSPGRLLAERAVKNAKRSFPGRIIGKLMRMASTRIDG